MKHVKFVKRTTLLLSTFLTLNICFIGEAGEFMEKANGDKIEDRVVLDEAHGIFEFADLMRDDFKTQSEACRRHCSLFARLLRPNFRNNSLIHRDWFQKKWLCERDFNELYEKQKRHYLTRKYMFLCAGGKSFDKQWSYDPENKRQNLTDKEVKWLRDPTNIICTEKCLDQYELAKKMIYCMDNPEVGDCPIGGPKVLADGISARSKRHN